MTRIRQALAALRDRLGSTLPGFRAREHLLGMRVVAVATSLLTLASGMALAAAPTASAVISCPSVGSSPFPFPVSPAPSAGTVADWSTCILRSVDLRNANLTVTNLAGADLFDARMNGVILTGTNLAGANLYGANLNGANMTDSDLTRVTFQWGDASNANLTRANLTGADLRDSVLESANLTGANLTGADLTGAHLGLVNLSGAFVNCGTGGDINLGSAYGGPPTNLPTGWTVTAGVLSVPIVACSGGGTAVPAGPAAPPLPAPQTLPPVAGIAPSTEVPAGGSTGTVNGVPVTTTVTVNPAGGVLVAGAGSTVALADIGPDGKPLPATGGGLAGRLGGGLSVQATGFLPQSQADVYMYSEQLWLGKATVDAGGNVAMGLAIPSWVTPGAHTLQFVGYQGPYTSIALSTGITVAAPAAASAAVQPVSGETTGYFRRGAIALAYAAKARLWNAVNAPAQGSAGANVACTVTHAQPGTPADQALWARRNAGIVGFLTRAGCDTIIARLGDLAGVTGAVGLAVRVTATAA